MEVAVAPVVLEVEEAEVGEQEQVSIKKFYNLDSFIYISCII